MPNHIHGIVVIHNQCPLSLSTKLGDSNSAVAPSSSLQPTALGRIVAYFKYQSAKAENERRNLPGEPVWQRNYHDHIIRGEQDLQRIRQYIRSNLSTGKTTPCSRMCPNVRP